MVFILNGFCCGSSEWVWERIGYKSLEVLGCGFLRCWVLCSIQIWCIILKQSTESESELGKKTNSWIHWTDSAISASQKTCQNHNMFINNSLPSAKQLLFQTKYSLVTQKYGENNHKPWLRCLENELAFVFCDLFRLNQAWKRDVRFVINGNDNETSAERVFFSFQEFAVLLKNGQDIQGD